MPKPPLALTPVTQGTIDASLGALPIAVPTLDLEHKCSAVGNTNRKSGMATPGAVPHVVDLETWPVLAYFQSKFAEFCLLFAVPVDSVRACALVLPVRLRSRGHQTVERQARAAPLH